MHSTAMNIDVSADLLLLYADEGAAVSAGWTSERSGAPARFIAQSAQVLLPGLVDEIHALPLLFTMILLRTLREPVLISIPSR
jgi:hypothetical protein